MKVSVIGMGAVGTETVRGLLNLPEVREIVAINRTRAKAEGEIEDLHHTTALPGTGRATLVVGDYPDLVGSDIVVVTSGIQPKAGGSREDVLRENCIIVREIMVEIESHASGSIVLIVTNPVDVTTQVALRHSRFSKNRLIGTGTLIDSIRLVRILSDHLVIDPTIVFAYVLGEHGNTGLIPWNLCRVCGMDVDTFCLLNEVDLFDKNSLRKQVLDAGYSIFNNKGDTKYGIGASISRLVRAIALDEKSVLPIGTLLEGEYGIGEVVMSLPCVIGRNGVEQIITCDFSEEELSQLRQSAYHIQQLVAVADMNL